MNDVPLGMQQLTLTKFDPAQLPVQSSRQM